MKRIFLLTSSIFLVMLTTTMIFTGAFSGASAETTVPPHSATTTATPVKHLVVIFQENISYDHYFGTYPNATNPANEPAFAAQGRTPSANGLMPQLIDSNPNSAKPFRLDRTQAITCDQNHDYKAEQEAYHGGLLDKFVEKVGATGKDCDPKQVMGYYDGNTVTALWNYAQHFAMGDNSFSTTFGPSTPGALNLVAGQTHGATPANIPDEVVNGTVIGDPDGTFDDCSKGQTVAMSGKNVGDLLNEKNITWGWFQGGFKPTGYNSSTGKVICGSFHTNIAGANVTDYSAHHEPFEYYASTSNPHHLPPSSVDMIGKTDQANHQYDLTNFWSAADSGNMPAVSFLKASKYQDGHAGYSDPLDEQKFLTTTINHLQKLLEWNNTAVIIMYDDSDGWYDHVMPPIVSQSNDPSSDALLGAEGLCGHASPGSYQDRCGYGPRQPFLVISPYAKMNYIDHQVTDQSSVLKFIEENWNLGRIGDQSFDAKAGPITQMFNFAAKDEGKRAPPLFLDYDTGNIIHEKTLKVRAVDKSGGQVQGVWTTIRTPEGVAVGSGFTPFSFVGREGSKYLVTVSNFDGKEFQNWQDNGSKSKERTITLSNDTELAALYDTGNSLRGFTPLTFTKTKAGGPELTVKTVALDGNKELHMWTIIAPQPQSASGSSNNSTTYKLYASTFHDYVFDHWNDGNMDRIHTVTISNSTTMTAYYKLGYGIASGDVTNTTAIVWSRADKAGTMHVQFDNNPGFPHAGSKTTAVDATTDYAGHIKLENLAPDTKYYYKVWFTTSMIGGNSVSTPTSSGTFRTAPNPSEDKPVSFVMGGDLGGQQYCSRVDVNYPIFMPMKALEPDFFVFNGDEIYADNNCPASGPAGVTGWNNIPGDFPKVNDPTVNWTDYSQVHDVYLKHWQYNRSDPNLQSLLRNVSMYSQADDHEVANNWAPSGYYSNTTMSRAGFPNLIKGGIQEFFNFAPIDRNQDDPNRIYRSFHWGKNVDLFIVDQHQYRSRNDLPDTPANNKTLLGKEQLAWLEHGLLNSKAVWKIVSLDDPITIPECAAKETVTTPLGCDNFAPDGKTNLTFTRERNEFLKFLDNYDIKNVIFIVTDVHFAGNIHVDQDFNGDKKNLNYYELANGPLSAGAGEPDNLDPTINAKYLYKEGPLFNFGYYKIQTQEDGKVHFISEVRGVDGSVRPGSYLDLIPQ